jgi:hypothetical protein
MTKFEDDLLFRVSSSDESVMMILTDESPLIDSSMMKIFFFCGTSVIHVTLHNPETEASLDAHSVSFLTQSHGSKHTTKHDSHITTFGSDAWMACECVKQIWNAVLRIVQVSVAPL